MDSSSKDRSRLSNCLRNSSSSYKDSWLRGVDVTEDGAFVCGVDRPVAVINGLPNYGTGTGIVRPKASPRRDDQPKGYAAQEVRRIGVDWWWQREW